MAMLLSKSMYTHAFDSFEGRSGQCLYKGVPFSDGCNIARRLRLRMLSRSVRADLRPGCAGEEAIQYFERTNPEYPRFGAGSTSDNHAEWIVDLTTKACP